MIRKFFIILVAMGTFFTTQAECAVDRDRRSAIYANAIAWGYGSPIPGIGYEHFWRATDYAFLNASLGVGVGVLQGLFETPLVLGIGIGKRERIYRPRALIRFITRHIPENNDHQIAMSFYLDVFHFNFNRVGLSFLRFGLNIWSFTIYNKRKYLESGVGDLEFSPLDINYLEIKIMFGPHSPLHET